MDPVLAPVRAMGTASGWLAGCQQRSWEAEKHGGRDEQEESDSHVNGRMVDSGSSSRAASTRVSYGTFALRLWLKVGGCIKGGF